MLSDFLIHTQIIIMISKPNIIKINLLWLLYSLNIETGRYKNIIRPERKCTNCSKGDIEDEKHFIVDCPLYENSRVKCVDKVIDSVSPNFRCMDTSSKFVWLFTNEHEQVLKKLGTFIEECFLLRRDTTDRMSYYSYYTCYIKCELIYDGIW